MAVAREPEIVTERIRRPAIFSESSSAKLPYFLTLSVAAGAFFDSHDDFLRIHAPDPTNSNVVVADIKECRAVDMTCRTH
jgi:hypothetical protein